MATVFDVFTQIPYDFLTISRGQVYGNRITARKSLMGIFKLKSGMNTSGDMELYESDATLHAHPEDFNTTDYTSLIGQGVAVNGVNYSIEGVSAGTNFDNGTVEHITMRLQKANFVEVTNGS